MGWHCDCKRYFGLPHAPNVLVSFPKAGVSEGASVSGAV